MLCPKQWRCRVAMYGAVRAQGNSDTQGGKRTVRGKDLSKREHAPCCPSQLQPNPPALSTTQKAQCLPDPCTRNPSCSWSALLGSTCLTPSCALLLPPLPLLTCCSLPRLVPTTRAAHVHTVVITHTPRCLGCLKLAPVLYVKLMLSLLVCSKSCQRTGSGERPSQYGELNSRAEHVQL